MEQVCCLYNLPEGACARVHSLNGCRDVCARLHALGFTPGAEVVSCGAGARGCRVRVRDACVVLDEDVAHSILCDMPGAGRGRHPRRP
jgi:Fe2+ transport system protein FeoA